MVAESDTTEVTLQQQHSIGTLFYSKPEFPIKKKKQSVKTNIILYIKLILDIRLPGIRTSISTLEQCVFEYKDFSWS